jgi:hypothetical protein
MTNNNTTRAFEPPARTEFSQGKARQGKARQGKFMTPPQ